MDVGSGKQRRLVQIKMLAGELTWSSDRDVLACEQVLEAEMGSAEQQRPRLGLLLVNARTGDARQTIQAHERCGWAW